MRLVLIDRIATNGHCWVYGVHPSATVLVHRDLLHSEDDAVEAADLDIREAFI